MNRVIGIAAAQAPSSTRPSMVITDVVRCANATGAVVAWVGAATVTEPSAPVCADADPGAAASERIQSAALATPAVHRFDSILCMGIDPEQGRREHPQRVRGTEREPTFSFASTGIVV